MRRIITAEHGQGLLLAPSVEDWVGPEHPARFVREFVATLDLKQVGLDTLRREEGGVAYDPRVLLGVWLYGYLRKVRSTRALERACREEMGFIWLTGNCRPDHNALWRFWNAHRAGIRALVTQSVRVAMKLELVGLVVQALDGTKIQACCSGRGGYDRAHLEKLLARVDQQLREQEAQIGSAPPEPSAELPAPLHRLSSLRSAISSALAQVEEQVRRHVHPQEPEANRMGVEGRNRFGYNAQAVVDAKVQVIVAAEATAEPDDHGQLVPMLAQAEQVHQASPLTLADGGYSNAAALSTVQAAGQPVLTPPPSQWRDTSQPYHASHFRHDAARQVVVCPQGRELPLQRRRFKDGRWLEVYRSTQVCRDCPVRTQCTKDRHGRTIDIQPGHAAVVAAHQQWQREDVRALYAQRSAIVEPVFAQIKQQMGFRRWTVRGLRQVQVQWALLCTAWNLNVIYRHWRAGAAGAITPRGPGGPRRPQPPAGGRWPRLGSSPLLLPQFLLIA
jgi:transposase